MNIEQQLDILVSTFLSGSPNSLEINCLPGDGTIDFVSKSMDMIRSYFRYDFTGSLSDSLTHGQINLNIRCMKKLKGSASSSFLIIGRHLTNDEIIALTKKSSNHVILLNLTDRETLLSNIDIDGSGSPKTTDMLFFEQYVQSFLEDRIPLTREQVAILTRTVDYHLSKMRMH